MLNLTRYLAEKTPEDLRAEYGIKSNQHKDYPNLRSFVYSQTDSPQRHPLVIEARGIVLDESAGWTPVARPFDRFFNWSKGNEDPISWAEDGTAIAATKEDGCLVLLYNYKGSWQVASKGMPDASGTLHDTEGVSKTTIAQLFWRTWESCGYELPTDDEADLTFVFELCTSLNEIVVKHGVSRLPLIGVRSRSTGVEYPTDDYEGRYVPVHAPRMTMEEIQESFRSMNPMECEGYVVRDGYFNRAKVKHPTYVAIHHLKSGLSHQKCLVEIARSGFADEVSETHPEFEKAIRLVEASYKGVVDQLVEAWGLYGSYSHRDYGMAQKKSKVPLGTLLFPLLGKTLDNPRETLESAVRACTVKRLVAVLDTRQAVKHLEELEGWFADASGNPHKIRHLPFGTYQISDGIVYTGKQEADGFDVHGEFDWHPKSDKSYMEYL